MTALAVAKPSTLLTTLWDAELACIEALRSVPTLTGDSSSATAESVAAMN
jgi:hypothetical protein